MTLPVIDQQDSADAREYNRTKRRLVMADVLLTLVLLIVLLATGLNGTLRDWAYHASHQSYSLAVFYYVVMLFVLSKVLGFGFDYYSFRLEHQFNLSNQKLRSWLWDETKTWIIGLLIAALLVEIIYNTIRLEPNWWWLIAWAVYNG